MSAADQQPVKGGNAELVADRASYSAADLPFAGLSRIVEEVLLVPPASHERPQPCGLFADGRPLAEGHSYSSSATVPVTVFPEPVETKERLAGTWLFGGILSAHFGHMLCEGTGRLWALEGRDDVAGILFFARPFDKARACARLFGGMAALLDLPPVRVVTVPTTAERVILAGQGLGVEELLDGQPQTRAFLRGRLAGVAPEGQGRRIFLTRGAIPAQRGRLFGEAGLEDLFAAAGYEVIRPEDHPLARQVAMFRAASHVVGAEGSPFHLLAMAGQVGCKVAVIRRRESAVYGQICQQLEVFLGTEVLRADMLRASYAPARIANRNRTYLEPGRPALSAALSAAGFLPDDCHWPDMTSEECAAESAALAAAIGHKLIRSDAVASGSVGSDAGQPS